MAKTSAGLLMYRSASAGLEVLLVHPGGPFWKHRDQGAWSIPKGEVNPDEPLLQAAMREFREETALEPRGPFLSLGAVRLSGGKRVHAWAFEGDCDPQAIQSNTFEVEWPPHSGRRATFPEVDRAAFYTIAAARRALHPAQARLIDRLLERVSGRRES
ncbi:MAG: NUDIX domain-containing protein [Polyangiaceae bacterium]|nr:NUDIX domain-containing protein [Polyangiaceae bacterium]